MLSQPLGEVGNGAVCCVQFRLEELHLGCEFQDVSVQLKCKNIADVAFALGCAIQLDRAPNSFHRPQGAFTRIGRNLSCEAERDRWRAPYLSMVHLLIAEAATVVPSYHTWYIDSRP